MAYSTFKASKCIYLEQAGVPHSEWAELVERKPGVRRLFGVEDAIYFNQRGQKRRVPDPEPELRSASSGGQRKGPLLPDPVPSSVGQRKGPLLPDPVP
jgi:hypothetical protein